MRGSRTPDVSVLVPCHGDSQRLATLLGDLAAQTLDPDRFEVIVVDDGSPTPLEAGATPFPLRLERQRQAGPGAARNRAIDLARAPLALILNDDARPAPDLVERHLALQAEAPPKTAILGAFPFSENALASAFVRVLAETDLLFDFATLRDGEIYDWRYFWTCNLSLPVEALRAVGGFDAERFSEPVCEDVELGYRLGRLGWRVWYRPDAHCEHDHTLTPAGYFRRMQRYGANLYRMWQKHGDASILGAAEGAEETLLRAVQLEMETLAPAYAKVASRLEALVESPEAVVPRETLDDIERLVRRVRVVPMARGIAEEATGLDPGRVLERGPHRGEPTSVVLVSHEALAKTRAALEALRRAADPDFPIQLIVVDNGSQDGSVEYLAAQPDVTLILNAENVGAPKARNQALSEVAHAWVVFLDGDACVYPGWLRRLRYHAEVDPRVGCVVPVSDRAAHGQQIDPGVASDRLPSFAAERARAFDRRAQYKTIFTSLCVLVRREVLERIGGFDERFSPWGFEDDDFSLRVHLAGYRSRMALDVFVHHPSYAGARQDRHRELLQRNWQRFVAKWGGSQRSAYGAYEFLAPVLSRRWEDGELHVPFAASGSETL